METKEIQVVEEENILKPFMYSSRFWNGDVRYTVELRTKKAVIFHHFCEN